MEQSADEIIKRVSEGLELRFASHQRHAHVWRAAGAFPSPARRTFRGLANLLSSSDVSPRFEIPRGVILLHKALGDVIHGDASLAPPAILFHQVTIGNAWDGTVEAPAIRPFSFFGVGAVALGDVKIGPFWAVAAGAVVLSDVPPLCLATGVPAVCQPLQRRHLRRWFEVTDDEIDFLLEHFATAE